jgi:anaerobic magnesium-protoporphyrin IX monomethyl ester cyclase
MREFQENAVADVLLTHSYHLPYDRKQVRKMQPYPPLGTLYAASVLRENGISVAVFDSMLEEPESGFRNALRAHGPKVVAIYEDDFNFLTKMCLTRMREVAFSMIDEARKSGARVIVHGSDATDHSIDYLRQGCEFALIGEAEHTLLQVIKEIRDGGNGRHVPGVATLRREGFGEIVEKQKPALARPFAGYPLPARDLIDIAKYREAWSAAHGAFSLNLIASRGCPFRCNWCAKPIFGDSYHARPAADVAEEMRHLKEAYAAEHLWFADDIFALNRHWTKQFAVEVNKKNAVVPFKIQARADLLTADTVQSLAYAGCAEVWMGVESGSQKVLDAMDKGVQVEEVVDARQHLRREGIRACYFIQFGYPGETWSDVLETIALVRETRPDDIGVSFSYPLPNTRFYERVRQQLGAKQNWSDSDDLCVMFKGAYTDFFYRAIRDALHAEVDSWKHGPSLHQAGELQQLWQRIESLEPVSRNSDATVLAHLEDTAARCDAHPKSRLIPVQRLVTSVGEA